MNDMKTATTVSSKYELVIFFSSPDGESRWQVQNMVTGTRTIPMTLPRCKRVLRDLQATEQA